MRRGTKEWKVEYITKYKQYKKYEKKIYGVTCSGNVQFMTHKTKQASI